MTEKDIEQNSKFSPLSSFTRLALGKAEKWLVDAAKEVNIDINNFEHEVTSHFINHALKAHGNEKKELARGQLPLTENDFDKITDLIKNPDYVMLGAKTKGKDIIAYSKKIDDGTNLYFEEVLDSNRHKSLVSKTMLKRQKDINKDKFLSIVSGANYSDITKAKIKSWRDIGSHPDFATTIEESSAAANSTQPAKLIHLLSGKTANLSSAKIDSVKIEKKEAGMAEIKIEDREEARGFVQGVCESAVVVAQKDKELSRKLLSELGVTKELSKKFAEPETFKALQKDVFAPPKVEREQTLERGRGISR